MPTLVLSDATAPDAHAALESINGALSVRAASVAIFGIFMARLLSWGVSFFVPADPFKYTEEVSFVMA